MKCDDTKHIPNYSGNNKYYKKPIKCPKINNRTIDLENCNGEYGTNATVTSKNLLDHKIYKHSKANVYKCHLCDYVTSQNGIPSGHMKRLQ